MGQSQPVAAGEKTVVIFRRDKEGIVFALMPELPADSQGQYCTCYQQVGQHSAADYFGCIGNSHPAQPGEYADLLAELQRRGYAVKVHRRATAAMQARRRREAQETG